LLYGRLPFLSWMSFDNNFEDFGLEKLSLRAVYRSIDWAHVDSGVDQKPSDPKPKPEPIPPMPDYFERNSSFYSRKHPSEIFQAITRYFTQVGVDYEYVKEKNKIRVVAIVNNVRCSFVVKVYRTSDSRKFLIEFQRRSGCVVAYRNCYTRAVSALGDLVLGKKPITQLDRWSMGEKLGYIHELDQASVQALYEIASCDSPELSVEALRALASAARLATNQSTFIQTIPLVSFIVSKLQSDDEDVQRVSGELLFHSCQWEQIQAQLVKEAWGPICDVLARLGSVPKLGDKDAKSFFVKLS